MSDHTFAFKLYLFTAFHDHETKVLTGQCSHLDCIFIYRKYEILYCLFTIFGKKEMYSVVCM